METELFSSSNAVDILLISETDFTDKDCFKINSYIAYCCTHPSGKEQSGSANLIKSNIRHYELNHYDKNILVWLQQDGITENQYFNYLCALGNRFVAGADQKSKHTAWGSRITTTREINQFEYLLLGIILVSSAGFLFDCIVGKVEI